MKRPLTYLLAGLMLTTAVSPLSAIAQDGPQGHYQDGHDRGPGDHGDDRGGDHGRGGPGGPGGDRGPGDHGRDGYGGPHQWARGERYQDHYHGRVVVVNDYHDRHLRQPPRGYHWVRDDSNNFLLVAVATGVITDMVLNSH